MCAEAESGSGTAEDYIIDGDLLDSNTSVLHAAMDILIVVVFLHLQRSSVVIASGAIVDDR
jgi:hypothetical protein